MKTRVILVAALVVCAFLAGMLVSLWAAADHEADKASDGGLTPPPLPEDVGADAPPANNSGNESLAGLFGDPNGIEPPSLPF